MQDISMLSKAVVGPDIWPLHPRTMSNSTMYGVLWA
jgi:hypothetical protein